MCLPVNSAIQCVAIDPFMTSVFLQIEADGATDFDAAKFEATANTQNFAQSAVAGMPPQHACR